MAEKTLKRRITNIVSWGVFIITMLLIFLAFAAFAWFSTETGRVYTSEKLLQLISRSDGLNFRYANIRSSSINQFYIEDLKVFQQRAPIAHIKKLELKWQAFALLSGRVYVNSLTADSVKVFDMPTSTESAPSQNTKLFRLPENFSLPNIRLRKLYVRHVNLEGLAEHYLPQHLSGQQQKNTRDVSLDFLAAKLLSFELQAQITTTSKNFVELGLLVHTNTQKPLELKIRGEQQADFRYALRVNVTEQEYGLVAEYLKLPDDETFSLALNTLLNYDKKALVVTLQKLSFPISDRRIHSEGRLTLDEKLVPLRVSSELELSVDDSYHTLSGDLIDDKVDIALALNNFPLDVFTPWLRDLNNGSVSATLSLSGPVKALKAQGELSANTRFKKNAIAVAAVGALQNNILTLTSSRVSLNESSAQAKGKIFIEPRRIDLAIEASKLNLDNLRSLQLEEYGLVLPPDLSLRIPKLKATLQGPAVRPLGKVDFAGAGVYRSIDFDFDAALEHRQEALEINHLIVNASGSESRLVGTFDIDSLETDLFIKAKKLPLELLEALQLELPRNFTAILSADGHVEGSIKNPKVDGDILLVGSFESLPFRLEAQGKYNDQEINIDTAVLQSNENTLLQGKGFYKNRHFDFKLAMDDLPTTFFESFGWTPYPGMLNADLALEGSIEMPRLHGQASYSAQTSVIDENNRKQVVPLKVTLAAASSEDSLSLISTFLRDETETGSLSMVIPNQIFDNIADRLGDGFAQLPIAASVTGAVDLQAVSFLALSDLNRLEGAIKSSLTVGGSVGAPDIDGVLEISHAYYENFVSGTVLNNITCRIDSKNSSFMLNDCKANDGHSGKLSLSGRFELPIQRFDAKDKDGGDTENSETPDILSSLDNLDMRKTIDIALTLSDFSPLEQPDIEAEISGELDAKGNFDKLYVSGGVEVSPLNIDISASFDSDIPTIDVDEVYDLGELVDEDVQTAPSRPEIFLDLDVNTEKQAYLRGRGLDVELGGKIKISGKASNIKYNGKFEVLRGTAEIFGKSFVITQGEVRFVDSQFSMLFKAEYEKFGQKIVAEISGGNNDLNLALSSTPSMAEDEILAFILFGKSVASMTPFEAIQLAAAVQKLRGGKSLFDPIGSAREILAVDTLSVSTEETESGESGVNIGIGKYLNERVYLEFERTPNPSQPWRGRLEIQLLPNLVLESSTGGKTGVEGAQLKWKRDY